MTQHHHDHGCSHEGPCEHDHVHEFFDREDDSDFVLDLDDALQAELEGTSYEAKAAALHEETPLDERVRVYQYLRGAGAIPESAGFFLVSWAIESIAEERVDDLYNRQFADRFARLIDEHGLDEELLAVLSKEELPEDYRALELELANAIDALTVATFQAFGEHKMAALYTADPDEFDRRYDEGYAYFFGETEGYRSELREDELQD